MSNGKKINIGSIIIGIILLIVLIGAIGAISLTTNGGKNDIRLFDIQYNNENIDGAIINIRNDGTPTVFQIVPKIPNDKITDIEVKIYPHKDNAETVAIKYGNKTDKLTAISDLTDLFNIEYGDNSISISSTWNLEEIIAKKFDIDKTTVEVTNFNEGIDYLVINFTKNKTTIKSSIVRLIVADDIILDTDKIIFR